MNIEELIKTQDKEVKAAPTKPDKSFATMTTSEKWALIEQLLRDLGRIK